MRAGYPQRLREVHLLCGLATTSAMTTLALFAVAALTFSLLAGVIEELLARRARRRLQRKGSPILHPLTHHRLRRVRSPLSFRAFQHLGLFFGFLLVTYLGLLFMRAAYRVVASWF